MSDLTIAALAAWRIITIAAGSLLVVLCVAAAVVPILVLWTTRK